MNWPTAFTIVALATAASLLLIVVVRESAENLRRFARLHDRSITHITAAVVELVRESLAPSMPPPEPEPDPVPPFTLSQQTEDRLRAEYGDAAVEVAMARVVDSKGWWLQREPEHEEDVDPLDLSTPLDFFNPYGQLDDDPDNPQPANDAYPEVEPQREGRAMSVPPGFDPIKQMQQDQEQADWIERGGLA